MVDIVSVNGALAVVAVGCGAPKLNDVGAAVVVAAIELAPNEGGAANPVPVAAPNVGNADAVVVCAWLAVAVDAPNKLKLGVAAVVAAGVETAGAEAANNPPLGAGVVVVIDEGAGVLNEKPGGADDAVVVVVAASGVFPNVSPPPPIEADVGIEGAEATACGPN